MPRTGRPKTELTLTPQEREQLVRWERRRKSSQALALRSRIVLRCAEGRSNKDVAVLCGVSQPTVGKWRRRFSELRLDGLGDEPRPGRPRTITVEQVERVVVDTLSVRSVGMKALACTAATKASIDHEWFACRGRPVRIGAAGWYAEAARRSQVHRLTKVHRQKNPDDIRDYALLREGKALDALESLED